MALKTTTCSNICEIDSQYPDSKSTSSCDCGYYSSGPKVNNCFFHMDGWVSGIPFGSIVTSATITVAQVSGGYSYSENIYITLRTWAWVAGGCTWNSQGSDAGCGTISVNLSGSGAGNRTFTITSLVQSLLNQKLTYDMIRFARNPNTTTGTQDAKRFSTTAANHHVDITYTAPGPRRMMHYKRRRSGLWVAG